VAIKFVPGMILLYLQLTERGHLQSTPVEQLCTYPSDATTAGNIFGSPAVEQLSVPTSHFFWMSSMS